jgi:hypothetical protein
MTETKFFRAENANRFIAGLRFETTEILAGTQIGVHAGQGEKLPELVKLAANPRSGVTEITEAEYIAALKKKAPALGNLNHTNNISPAVDQVAIKGAGAQVVQEGNVTRMPEKKLETVADALQMNVVKPPPDDLPNLPLPKPKPAAAPTAVKSK